MIIIIESSAYEGNGSIHDHTLFYYSDPLVFFFFTTDNDILYSYTENEVPWWQAEVVCWTCVPDRRDREKENDTAR